MWIQAKADGGGLSDGICLCGTAYAEGGNQGEQSVQLANERVM